MQTALILPPVGGSTVPGAETVAARGAGGDLSLVSKGEGARFNSVLKRLLRKGRSAAGTQANRRAPVEAPLGTPAQMAEGVGLPRGSPPSTGPPAGDSPPAKALLPTTGEASTEEPPLEEPTGGDGTAEGAEDNPGPLIQEAVMDLFEELQLPTQALPIMSQLQQAVSALSGAAGEMPGIGELGEIGALLSAPQGAQLPSAAGGSLTTPGTPAVFPDPSGARPAPLLFQAPAGAQPFHREGVPDPPSGTIEPPVSTQGAVGANGPAKQIHEAFERAPVELFDVPPPGEIETPVAGPVGGAVPGSPGNMEEAAQIPALKPTVLIRPVPEAGGSGNNGDPTDKTTTIPFAALVGGKGASIELVSVRGVTVHLPTFLQDVAERVALGYTRLSPEHGTMELHLNPPELGRLTVRVALEDGLLKAHFVTPAADVKQLLESQMASLRQLLEAQGLAIQDLLVSLRGDHDQTGTPQHGEDPGGARQPASGLAPDEAAPYRLVVAPSTAGTVDYLA